MCRGSFQNATQGWVRTEIMATLCETRLCLPQVPAPFVVGVGPGYRVIPESPVRIFRTPKELLGVSPCLFSRLLLLSRHSQAGQTSARTLYPSSQLNRIDTVGALNHPGNRVPMLDW
jgi:hypothetical protein